MLANFVKSITTVYGSIIRYTSRNFVNIALLRVDIRFNFLYLGKFTLNLQCIDNLPADSKSYEYANHCYHNTDKSIERNIGKRDIKARHHNSQYESPTRGTNESIILRFFFILFRYYFPIIFKYAWMISLWRF